MVNKNLFLIGLIMFYPLVIYVIFGFIPCKIFSLDFVFVIWRFFILDLHEFWPYKIKYMAWGKPKFAQINTGVNKNLLKLQGVKFFMKVQNQKIFKLKGWNSKKIFYRGKTGNDPYYRGKDILTLIIIYQQFSLLC